MPNLSTGNTLKDQIMKTAKGTKDLRASVTVPLGAVLSGPLPVNPAPVSGSPAPGGAASPAGHGEV